MTRFRRYRGLVVWLVGLLLPGVVYAQGAVITGTVKSEQGQVLGAVRVAIEELNVAVATNDQGVYRITLAPERVRGQVVVLRVRAIGYQPQTRQLTLNPGTYTEDFTLRVDINRLSEVVVTGVTGATETKKLAFTVSKVDQADMPVVGRTALEALQGKVTGAKVVLPSGRPGTAPSIVLRGAKSLNLSLTPLIIVDGVVFQGALQDLNPDDIESMEVIKGAAAASTYGSRAQNGVITITTKSGRSAAQGARFSMRSENGFSDVQSEYPFSRLHWLVMDETHTKFCIVQTGLPPCSRVVDFEAEAFRVNDQGEIAALSPYNFERDAGIGLSLSKPLLKGIFQVEQWPKRYNPIAQVVQPGLYNNTNLDMSGRFNNTAMFASVGNFYQQGAIRFLKGYRRNSARLNIDQQVSDEMSVSLNTTYSKTANYPTIDFFRVTRVPAAVDLLRRDSRGRLFIRSNPLNQGQQNQNPLYDGENLASRSDVDRYLGSLTARYTPFPWLDFEAIAATDRRRSSGFTQREKGYRVTALAQSSVYLGTLSESSDLDEAWNVSLQGTARKSNFVLDGLDVRLNARYAFERQDSWGVSAGGNTLAVPGLLTLNNVTVVSSPSSSRTSVRAMGILGGVAFDYKGKYIVDALFRRDGSSLFGAAERWHPYYRASLAWRLSDEGWWGLSGVVNDLKLRASVGTAGGRPGFTYQYETFTIGTGGTVTSNQLGNRFLKPENTTETEFGLDAELYRKYGLNVTYSRSITDDIMLQVPVSSSSGFSSQWRNAGAIENRTWEASLNVPVVTSATATWVWRFSYDRNRAYLTKLNVPEFTRTTESSRFEFRAGERLGNVYGTYFVRDCSDLPAQFAANCGGPGSQFQRNDEGYIVWTGGYLPTEGITRNLWQAVLPGCLVNGVPVNQTGEVNCRAAGGVVNNPWAIPALHWGMLIVLRDSTANKVFRKLGNTEPDFRLSWSQNFNWKRLTVYALVDGSYGNKLFNEEVHWSLGDFMVRYEDQEGKNLGNAKPLGYYWRATSPDNGAGVGGYYDVLGVNNHTFEKGAYTKLREVSVSYAFGPIRGVGDWSLSVVGRNLWTITDFLGWDPETGGGVLNSSAIGAVAAYQYPQTRTFTVTLQTRF